VRFFNLLIIFLLSSLSAFAQQVFTEKVQEASKNGGQIIIVQDDSLSHAVNFGETFYGDGIDFSVTDSTLIATSKLRLYGVKKRNPSEKLKVDSSKKVNGYRVQIYAGIGADGKKNAQIAAARCRKAIPGISVYVKFVQPRWVCHVGDFGSRPDADVVAAKLRKSKLTTGQVMVVRSGVFLAQ
jgi:hypothetical protein